MGSIINRFLPRFMAALLVFSCVLLESMGASAALITLQRVSQINATTTPFGTIQGAYDDNGTVSSDELRSRDECLAEVLDFDKPLDVILSGGYDAGFLTNAGMTTVNGLTVSNGSVMIGNFAVSPEDCAASRHQLTVTRSGPGSGTVQSTDNLIDCGSTCSYIYPNGEPVTLDATPDTGWLFGGWSGPCTGTGSCSLSVSGPTTVDASFVECLTSSTCPGSDTSCRTRTCTAGLGGTSFEPDGTPTPDQTPGDCQSNVCDGAGEIVSIPDNADLPPDDGNQCTNDTCSAGIPIQPFAPSGTFCFQNGGIFCDGSGSCVECLVPTDCPGVDTTCRARTCTAGMCGASFESYGTPTPDQLPGDCQINVCDGAGEIVSIPDNADFPPEDGNQCTLEVCLGGMPFPEPAPPGTLCTQNGGIMCDGIGFCVQCQTAPDCPGMDTACQTRACMAGFCDFFYVPYGMPCDENGGTQCDGIGSCIP